MKIQKILKPDAPIVFVDNRELQSDIVKYMMNHDVQIKTSNLEVSDFICSDRVAIERKTIKDFLTSIVDHRLFRQLNDLSESYERPILIIEGNPELLYSERSISPNAIKGVLSHIAVDSKIPILWTINSKDTAELVYRIAYREQIAQKRTVSIRSSKKMKSVDDYQEHLVAGLPNINSKLTRRLLDYFKTPKKIFSATVEELTEIEGVGKKKAERIYEILNNKYRR